MRKGYYSFKTLCFHKKNLRSPDPLKNRGWTLDKNPTVMYEYMPLYYLGSLIAGPKSKPHTQGLNTKEYMRGPIPKIYGAFHKLQFTVVAATRMCARAYAPAKYQHL